MNDNPYQSPHHSGQSNAYRIGGYDLKVVRATRFLGILLLIQGFLQPISSIVGIFLFQMFNKNLPLLLTFFSLISLMHILAGIWVLDLKGRMFGITTLLLGLANALTLVSALPAIALAVFGLLLLFHPAARKAFELREKGQTRDQVLRFFESQEFNDGS
ncbi:MAG: hypothetical protein AAFN77_20040 [Planctomycetota bacterium]